MSIRTTTRHNADGSITKRTTYSRQTLFGNRKTESFVERIPADGKQGHSILLHLLLCCVGIGFITIPYYTLSSRHKWHLWRPVTAKPSQASWSATSGNKKSPSLGDFQEGQSRGCSSFFLSVFLTACLFLVYSFRQRGQNPLNLSIQNLSILASQILPSYRHKRNDFFSSI